MQSQSVSSEDQTISGCEASVTEEKMEAYVDEITQKNFWNYFSTAIRLKNENNFDEAMIILKALMVKGSQIYNSELNISLAEIYFQLGNAALEKLEQSGELVAREMPATQPANNGLATGSNSTNQQQNLRASPQPNDENSQKSKPSTSRQNQQEQDHNEDGENDEDIEEIQIAWENLDTCRLIIERYLNEQQNLKEEDRVQLSIKLASCYQRLGDSESFKEDFGSALSEYNKSLEIYEGIDRPTLLRRISELNFLIANALIYQNREASLEKALEHFSKGKLALETKLELVKNQPQNISTENEIIILQDLIRSFEDKILEAEDELSMRETVQTEKKKLQETATSKPNGFAKSEFNEETVEVKKLGKFGGVQKREPSTILSNEDKPRKKIHTEENEVAQKSTSDHQSNHNSN